MANVLVISETPQRVIIRDEAATRTVKVVALGPQGPSGNVNPLMFEMLDQAHDAARSALISENAAGEHLAATSIRADEAEASAASALASQQSSTTSAESATQSAASASASANTAISSASSASLSASSANTSATNAQASATTATTKASEAAASAVAAQGAAAGVQANSEAAASSAVAAAASQSAAAASESSASGSATSASASASAASVSATNAAGSATSAGNSATAAATSATTASTKAGEASASAASALDSKDAASVAAQFAINAQSAAQTSANAALASKNAAATSATGASNSATAAAGSASAAAASATSASDSATTAADKASDASDSEVNAAASAATATTKAGEASTSATSAAASAAAAATSATNTANALVGERSAVATLTNKTITGGTVNPATLQEGGVDAVIQSDVGTEPNQIPLNQYLGPLAYRDENPAGAVVGTTAVQVLSGKSFSDNVGAGTSTPAVRLDVLEGNRPDSGNAANLQVFTSNTATQGIGGTVGLGGFFSGTTSKVAFGSIRGAKENATENNFSGYLSFQTIAQGGSLTERMRITSGGNVGIGVTPSVKFHTRTDGAGLDTVARIERTNGSDGFSLNFNIDADANVAEIRAGGTQMGALTFATSNTERLRIDSAGNVGIGQAPAPWGSAHRTAQVFGTSIIGSVDGINGYWATNSHFDGANWRYITAGYTAMCYQSGGQHVWSSAGSGAAGAPVTFVERMRTTTDGYLRLASGGIQFNGDTAAANALDDYEEGTFTPTIIGETTAGVGTYTAQLGRYTKVGNRVHYSIVLAWTAHTGVGNMRIAGLPFAASAVTNNQQTGSVFHSNLSYTAGNQVSAIVNAGSTALLLRQSSASAAAAAIGIDTEASFYVSGHYEV